MGVIWTPGKTRTTQPQGRVDIAPEWQDYVLSASIGGSFYNVAQGTFDETVATVNAGVNRGGTSDIPTTALPYAGIIETATPGVSFIILASFVPESRTVVRQVFAYQGAGGNICQFRTAGSDIQFIRFRGTATAVTIAAPLGFSSGQHGTALAWSNGRNFGIIAPGGETTGVIGDPATSWGEANGYARWYQRWSGSAAAEPGIHQTTLRAILRDPGTQDARRDLQRNPWQIFKPRTRTIFLPTTVSGIPFLSLPFASGITAGSATPNVTLTF